MTAQPVNPDLTPEQRDILFGKGTEPPFSAQLPGVHENDYTCANCGAVLFVGSALYDSDEPGLAGWPSFAEVAKSGAVRLAEDTSHGMHRTEVTCANCGGHLGHLFPDDSSPSGQHYCINASVLDFKKRP